MSLRLAEQIHFLYTLLLADKKQGKAIFLTLSDAQVDVISEIVFNLLNKIPLDKKSDQKVLQRREYLKRLATIKTSVARRRNLLKKYWKQILQILVHFSDNILKVARLS